MVIALARTILLYLLIIVGVRLMGKRQVGELEPSELVLAMLISDLAAVPMQDFGIPLLFGVVPIAALLCLTMFLSMLTMKSVRFRALMCGRPSILIQDGVICQKEMSKTRLTVDELLEELRLQGVYDLTTVKYAILETNGQLSVLLYAKHQPVTAEQLSLTPEDPTIPTLLINNGRLLKQNLLHRGLNEAWLQKQLEARQLSSIQDVYLLSVDEGGKVYLAPRKAVI